MSSNPLWQLFLFRMREFYREPAVLFWALIFPLAMMVVLGLAFRPQPAAPVPVLVAVPAGDAYADGMRAALAASGDLKVIAREPEEAQRALTRGEAALLVIPVKASVPVYRYDPTHPEARTTKLLVNEALRAYLTHVAPRVGHPRVEVDPASNVDRVRADDFEVATASALEEKSPAPGSRYIDWFVPGMVGLSIMNGSLWGLGFALVEMRAKRLLKRFAVTPMKRSHFLLAQALQRFLVVGFQATVMLVFAWIAFGVEVRGSFLAFGAVAVVGTLAFGGVALLVAARPQNTEVAAGVMNIPMLPMMFLSGVFFSSSKFPDWLQPAIKALPLTALVDAFRRIANEGMGVASVWRELLILAAWLVVTLAVALKIFRWR